MVTSAHTNNLYHVRSVGWCLAQDEFNGDQSTESDSTLVAICDDMLYQWNSGDVPSAVAMLLA